MAPLIEVPPPNRWRGASSIAAAKASALRSSPIRVQSTTWTCIAGPVHCTMVTAIAWLPPERIACSTRAMAEGRHVALLLQLEAVLVDAARGIDREHELQVDRGLRGRRRGRR